MRSWLIFLVGLICGVAVLVAVQQYPPMSRAPVPAASEGAVAHAESNQEADATTKEPPARPVPTATTEATPPPAPSAVSTASTATAWDDLLLPVQGISPNDITDTFTDARSENRVHDAIDIMAARGTPVLAAHDGQIVKLFTSVRGGLTIYEFDPERTHAYYYAHLDRYADGIVAGKHVQRGEVIGYVGSTGNASADAPHLHFAIFVLGPEKNWWQGDAINPYPLLRRPPN